MTTPTPAPDTQIAEWRAALLRGRTVNEADADELESHLREQIGDLQHAGLAGDEAFLIAVKRLGQVDLITAEFAREHSDRLWKQLAVARPADDRGHPVLLMLGFAVLAGLLLLAGRLIADSSEEALGWFVRNIGLLVLPVLAAYFAVLRRMPIRRALALAAVVAALALVTNLFPVDPAGSTGLLIAIHLPVLLWFAVGFGYLGGDLRSSTRRMDFIRFTGEWVIYYVLIALGGGVLVGLTALVLSPIAPGVIDDILSWVVPMGAAAAVIVAAWLVEAKKSVIENIAPVLTAIFTPLFAVMLLVSAVVYAVAGIGSDFDRDLLTGFDVLLLVVLALVVYGISAREPSRWAAWMDALRLIAVVAAIVLDVLVLVSMLGRVGEFGFTANRVAALGLNILLLVNLVGTAWFTSRILAGRASAIRLERWQTAYLAVFAVWVLLVVLALPPIFGFA